MNVRADGDGVMSKFSFLNILKSQAKDLADKQGVQLSVALESVAKQSGFNSYHELATVAKRDPQDFRLMQAALGTFDLKEVVYEPDVISIINSMAEDSLSSETAMTNASMFMVENQEVTDADYDERTGQLSIEFSFEYNGDQDTDRVFYGSSFYVSASLHLVRRKGAWHISEPHGFEVHSVDRDIDRMSS